jgi:bifunctional non-homologous end joining protein LigD
MPLAEAQLVAQIEYADWTDVNHLRHSKFIALRDDKPPKDVRRERPVGRLIPPTEARHPRYAKQPGNEKGANVRL